MWITKTTNFHDSQGLQQNLININRIKQAEKCCNTYASLVFKISVNNLVNIVDYLSFIELREIGKVNGIFNQISKQDLVLIKFSILKKSK